MALTNVDQGNKRVLEFSAARADAAPMGEYSRQLAYALLAGFVLADAIFVAALRVSVSPTVAFTSMLFLPLWIGGLLCPRIGYDRLGTALEAAGMIFIPSVFGLVLLFCLTIVSGPLADPTLVRLDAALGLDWRAYIAVFAAHPWLISATFPFYMLLMVGTPALIITLAFMGKSPWRITAAWIVGLVITSAIYPFLPALGAYQYFGVQQIGGHDLATAHDFGPVIEAIKAGNRHFTYSMVTGFVSFPSFHSAAGAICIMEAARYRRTAFLFIVPNAIMIAVAPVFGGHYFVDVIAGVVCGLAAWAICSTRLWWTGVSKRRLEAVTR